jgi:sugar phosphate isomerase/epimerase
MSVYNPTTLLRLRDAAGETIGANLDPSHLLWQNVDVLTTARTLARNRALFHVHAKDTSLDRGNLALNGVLDPRPPEQMAERAWSFRTVGYGQGEGFWRALIEELRAADYDGTLAIEHEDQSLSRDEALAHATALLRRCLAT